MRRGDDRGRRCGALDGIELFEIDAGLAVMRMQVAPNHANGHRICHGGVTFTLADTAFAHACKAQRILDNRPRG